MEKMDPLYTLGGDVNWCSHYGKQNGGSSNNLKYNYQQFHFWVSIWKKNENTTLKRYIHPHVHIALFTI